MSRESESDREQLNFPKSFVFSFYPNTHTHTHLYVYESIFSLQYAITEMSCVPSISTSGSTMGTLDVWRDRGSEYIECLMRDYILYTYMYGERESIE